MKKIVVPCDFSRQAITAFRIAVDIALQSKGEVLLVNVVELPYMHDTVLMPVLTFEESLLKELKQKAEKQFEKLEAKYASEEVKIKTSVIFGTVSVVIPEYIRDQKADLVVMGTHGASGVREYLIGSNAEKIVRRCPVPVLCVKKYVKLSSVRTIIFPNAYDTEMHDDFVIKVKSLQNFFKARIHVVWINTPINFTRDGITRKRLNAFVKKFMFKDCTVHVYNDQYEETGIINFTHEMNGDLIAMGTHGRKGLAHVLSGSVTEDVVNHVDCPIWTCTI